jgi:hypothetical protein
MVCSVCNVESSFVQLQFYQHPLSIQCSTVRYRVISKSSYSVRGGGFDLQGTVGIDCILVDDHDRHDLFKHNRLSQSI